WPCGRGGPRAAELRLVFGVEQPLEQSHGFRRQCRVLIIERGRLRVDGARLRRGWVVRRGRWWWRRRRLVASGGPQPVGLRLVAVEAVRLADKAELRCKLHRRVVAG